MLSEVYELLLLLPVDHVVEELQIPQLVLLLNLGRNIQVNMGTGKGQTGNRERGTTWQTGSNGGQARSR